MTSPEVWIGLVGVVPENGNTTLGESVAGAYVNVLCYALDNEEYVQKVTNALLHDGFEVLEVEDVEPLSRRMANYEVDRELVEIAREVERTRAVGWGTFHIFPPKGAN